MLAALLATSGPSTSLAFVASPLHHARPSDLVLWRATVAACGGDIIDETASGHASKRAFEICQLDLEKKEIEECRVVYEDDLNEVLDDESVARVLGSPPGEDLFFQTNVDTMVANVDESDAVSAAQEFGGLLSVAEWQECLNEDICEVPDDVLLKSIGPDAGRVVDNLKGTQTLAPIERRFHVHFGAGRLGMGLVVPAISASGTPFAVIQRPKRKWMELFHRQGNVSDVDAIEVSVNSGIVVHNVNVLNSQADAEPLLMPPHSLIFGSAPDELEFVMSRATSFSCSLGSAMATVLVPLLSERPEAALDEQPYLFCCENDHAAVARLKERLAGRVRVADCMVDRVCTGRTISSEGVDVAAEPWRGSIVVLEPDIKGRLPFSSLVATAPSSQAEADYLSERKFSLVNGMHTVLAFMTLCELYEEGDGGAEYILLKYTKVPRAQQRMLEAWRAARVAELLDKYGTRNIMRWHGLDDEHAVWELLLSHADRILEERFSLTDDVVSRVLGGGVANRWLTRLRPTAEWLTDRCRREWFVAATDADPSENLLEPRVAPFFEYAAQRDRQRALERGCTLEDAEWRGCDVEEPCLLDEACDSSAQVLSYLTELVESSRRFCSRENEIMHKTLIKEQRKAGGKANAERVQEAFERQKGRGI